MKKSLQTAFQTRQYMYSEDFEIYYYSDRDLIQVENHAHSYYEFYIFLEGNVTMVIEGKRHPLQKGDVILLPPGTRHYVVMEDTRLPYQRFVFWVRRQFMEKLCGISEEYEYLPGKVQELGQYIFHNEIVEFYEIQSKVFRLIEELHGDRYGRQAQLFLCVSDLLLLLNRRIYERDFPRNAEKKENLYQGLLEYIDDHLEEDLSLEKLAGIFYSSKYHISHVFKDHVGISVHQYVLKKRLSACRGMLSGKESIGTLCLKYGFKDYSCFYRMFKREFGVSPTECRRQMQKVQCVKKD